MLISNIDEKCSRQYYAVDKALDFMVKESMLEKVMCRFSKRQLLVLIPLIFIFGLVLLTPKNIPESDKENFSQSPFLSSLKKFAPELPDFLFVNKNCLCSSAAPTMLSPHILATAFFGQETRQEIVEHRVKSGESLWSIAQKYDITIETIVWANDIKNLLIQPDQKLLILPVTGTMHIVEAGDNIDEIAKYYQSTSQKITNINDIFADEIVIGQLLIIPDGLMPTTGSRIQTIPLSQMSTSDFYGQSHSYPYGQCTWWVAQKRAIPAWGNAVDWLNNAILAGKRVCKGRWCTPRVGAVICLKGDRTYGHVAYVEAAYGDKVRFSEMNYIGWGKVNYRTLRLGSYSILGYIY